MSSSTRGRAWTRDKPRVYLDTRVETRRVPSGGFADNGLVDRLIG